MEMCISICHLTPFQLSLSNYTVLLFNGKKKFSIIVLIVLLVLSYDKCRVSA
jgi:hypothetical protein